VAGGAVAGGAVAGGAVGAGACDAAAGEGAADGVAVVVGALAGGSCRRMTMRTTLVAGRGAARRAASVDVAYAASFAGVAAPADASVRAAIVAISASVADVLAPARTMRDAPAGCPRRDVPVPARRSCRRRRRSACSSPGMVRASPTALHHRPSVR
jgi:hypothetical protein